MAKKNTSAWLRFSTMGLQLGLTIYLGSLLGEFLDKKYPSESISYHKVITLFAVFGATFSVIRQVIQLSKDEEKN
jgi:uncharacterized membrane protein